MPTTDKTTSPTTDKTTSPISGTIHNLLKQFNQENGTRIDLSHNFNSVGTKLETYFNKNFFPILNGQSNITDLLVNKYQWRAKPLDNFGTLSQLQVFLDNVPSGINFEGDILEVLRPYFPYMATQIYEPARHKKIKFSLNDIAMRNNFYSVGDFCKWYHDLVKKRISDINVSEEIEINATLIHYANNITLNKENQPYKHQVAEVNSFEECFNAVSLALKNLDNNTYKYNDIHLTSGGKFAMYRTRTPIENVMIVTTDEVYNYFTNTHLPNTFNAQGIDFSKHVISFDDLGGAYEFTKEVTIKEEDTIRFFKEFGMYEINKGSKIYKGDILTIPLKEFDIAELKGCYEEIVPKSPYFCMITDIRNLVYNQDTNDMVTGGKNMENKHYTYWLHYSSRKMFLPFYNRKVITGAD